MKPIAKTVLFLMLFNVLNGVLAYGIRILFAREMSLAEYGLFYAAFALVSFFIPLRSLGFNDTLVYYINKFSAAGQEGKIKRVVMISASIQLLMTAAFIAAALIAKHALVGQYFKDPRSGPLLDVLLLFFVADIFLSLLGTILYAYHRIVQSRMLETLRLLSLAVAAFWLFQVLAEKSLTPALAYAIGSLVALLVGGFFLFGTFRGLIRAQAAPQRELFSEILAYNWPVTLTYIIAPLITYSDVILLTLFKGVESVGIYNVAYPAAYAITLFASSFTALIFPRIARHHHRGEKSAIADVVRFIYGHLLLFFLPLALLFLAYADLIISVMFGPAYVGAANTFRIFSLGSILMVLWDVNSNILGGTGQVGKRSAIIGLTALLNIVLCLVFIPPFGPTGAAIATCASFLFLTISTSLAIRKEYGLRIDLLEQGRIFLAALCFLGAVILLKRLLALPNPLVEAAAVMVIAGVVYLVALVALRVLTPEKVAFFKNAFYAERRG